MVSCVLTSFLGGPHRNLKSRFSWVWGKCRVQ